MAHEINTRITKSFESSFHKFNNACAKHFSDTNFFYPLFGREGSQTKKSKAGYKNSQHRGDPGEVPHQFFIIEFFRVLFIRKLIFKREGGIVSVKNGFYQRNRLDADIFGLKRTSMKPTPSPYYI